MNTLRAMPVLQVSDMGRSIDFYKRMGFSGLGWEDEQTGEVFFTIAQRGDVTIGLQLLRGPLRVNTHWAAYVYVDDLPALHREFAGEGLAPTEIRHPETYGCDDFDISDPDGHLIAFGQSRDPVPGPGLSERRGRG